MTRDRVEATKCIGAGKQVKKKGEMGNLSLQKRELPKLLRIVFSQEDSIPGSGKPMAMK